MDADPKLHSRRLFNDVSPPVVAMKNNSGLEHRLMETRVRLQGTRGMYSGRIMVQLFGFNEAASKHNVICLYYVCILLYFECKCIDKLKIDACA